MRCRSSVYWVIWRHLRGAVGHIAGPIFERRLVGQDVVLLCRGLPVTSFRKGDSIGRDVAIAALLRVAAG